MSEQLNYKVEILKYIDKHGQGTARSIGDELKSFMLKWENYTFTYGQPRQIYERVGEKLENMRKKNILEWVTPHNGINVAYRRRVKHGHIRVPKNE